MSTATVQRPLTYDAVIAKEVADFDRDVLETAKAMCRPKTVSKGPKALKAAKAIRKSSK